MAETATAQEPVIDKGAETAFLDKAFKWAVGLSEDGKSCPCCGYILPYENAKEKERFAYLNTHIRENHADRVLVGYPSRDIDAISKLMEQEAAELDGTANVYGVPGLEVVEGDDNYNVLELPNEMVQKSKNSGDRFHWASPRKATRWKNKGYEVVTGKTADGTFRANEMILLRAKPQLAEQRDKIKKQAVNNSIVARQEDFANKMDGVVREVYDKTAKLHGKDVARNIARAVGTGLTTGKISIRDRTGTKEY